MQNHLRLITRHRFARFFVVGVWNTLFDLSLFNIFLTLSAGWKTGHARVILCNIASSTIAGLVSYELNQKFVFKSEKKLPPHYRVYFLAIVFSSIFILQNLVFVIIHRYGSGVVTLAHEVVKFIGIGLTRDRVENNVAKLAAAACTMVWNFLLFQKFVFKSSKPAQ